MNAWGRRVFSLLMRAYPREFREHYEASMTDHLQTEEIGWRSAFRTGADVLSTSIGMRLENIWRDITYAVRMNAKAPLFTIVVLGTIALATATNTIAFALLNAVLLKPLPYANAGQLGFVWASNAKNNGEIFTTLANVQADALARGSKTIASLTYSLPWDTVSTDAGATLHRVQAKANYFSTLGVRPVLGRFLNDGFPAHQVVISSALWNSRFGAALSVLGQQLKLEGVAYTIVGVAPPGMLDPGPLGLERSDVWTKLPVFPVNTGDAVMFPVYPLVRLNDGVTWEAAQADITRLQHTLKGREAPFLGSTYHAGPLVDQLFSLARSFFSLVFAAVTGVLLIACANVANLLLARAAVREPEFTVRSAIGASSRRIASQVFTETLLLAAAGAAIGVAIASAALPLARAAVPGHLPRIETARIDAVVLLYVLALLVAVTLLTGMVPAYKRSRKGRRDAASRVRPVLVVVETAIAFALTTAFGVMLHSFVSMTSVPLGFDPNNVYVANVHPNHNTIFSASIAGAPSQSESLSGIENHIRALPGVVDVAAATSAPFSNAFRMQLQLTGGWNGEQGGPPLQVTATQVGTSYFRVLGIPIIEGAGFTKADSSRNTGSVIVNQAFARMYFPHGQVVGKRIRMSPVSWHVVGVVADARNSFKDSPQPLLYLPFNGGFGPYFGVVIRTAHQVPNLAKDVTVVLKRASPGAGTVTVTSLPDLVAQDASGMKTSLELLGALAAVALILALFGIYGVVAYGTERRFHEIGIRMAVGARPWNIVSIIVGSSLVQAMIGVACGLVLCALTTQLLATQLYKTSPLDPPALIAVAAVLLACTACASIIPAWRAAFMRPSETLRYE